MDKSLSPESSELNHRDYSDGCKHFSNGDFKRAIKSFRSALDYWPEDPQAWLALGNCYNEINRPKKAEECFKQSVQYTDVKSASIAYYNLGNSLYDQGRFNEAIEKYKLVDGQSDVYVHAKRNMQLAKDELA